jgi:hypothetical protein
VRQQVVYCGRQRLAEHENGRKFTKNRTKCQLSQPSCDAARRVLEDGDMLGRAKATHNARGEVAVRTDLQKSQENLRALSTPPYPAVDRMSPDTCRTGMRPAPLRIRPSFGPLS